MTIVHTLRHVVSGGGLDVSILAALIELLPDSRVRDRLTSIGTPLPSVEEYAKRFGTTGYVVDAVPLAVVAAIQTTDILDSIEQIVRCGGDTDTVAALCGQMVGAAQGSQSLPLKIVDQIDAAVLIRETAGTLAGMLV